MIDEEEDDGDTGGDALPELAQDDRYSGIRALWLKVIIRAIFDWVTYRDSTRLLQRKLADNAYEWLFKPSLLFNGFESICRYLDVDPDTVRERAKKMSREDVAKIEHLERFAIPEKPVLKSPRMLYRGSCSRDDNERATNEGV